MSIDGWLERFQEEYLRLRGSGLTLSPLDLDRVRSWRDRGLPLDLALQGLAAAHAAWVQGGRANRARPFPLWAAERHLDGLVQDWERRSAGRATLDPSVAPSRAPARAAGIAIDRLEERIRSTQGTPPAARAWRAAVSVLRQTGDPDGSARLLEADVAAGIAYLVALPRHERADVVSEAMRRAGPRGASTRSRHRAMLRAVLAEAAFRHGGFERPSDL